LLQESYSQLGKGQIKPVIRDIVGFQRIISNSFGYSKTMTGKSTDERVENAWQQYIATLSNQHPQKFVPTPEAWQFGFGGEMADRLGGLVMSGKKTATCSRYSGENIVEEAGLSFILDGSGEPLCLIDTFEITVRKYSEIDAEWAEAEGEGDLSLEYWQNAHKNFFTKAGKIHGYEFSEDMLLACERFKVVYKFT